MDASFPTPLPSFLTISDSEFLGNLSKIAKPKPRSEHTYHNIHLPELNARLSLDLSIPELQAPAENDPFAATPDSSNTSRINVVYLGNSMLERLKTTGKATKLATLKTAWNAGCGGDKNENVLHRLSLGMYDMLKRENKNKDIKLWVVASGTNNLRPKRSFSDADLLSYRVLLEACLRIAPESTVLACDMFFRKDIPDEIVERSNEMLKGVLRDMNEELGKEGVVWAEARAKVGREMLVDHVHLDEEGYAVWDEILWPHVAAVLGTVNGGQN